MKDRVMAGPKVETVHEEAEVPTELLPFFVEESTNLIYEAKFFDDFVIVRPASPAFATAIRKLDHNEFAREFKEFWGDPDPVRVFLYGTVPGDPEDEVTLID